MAKIFVTTEAGDEFVRFDEFEDAVVAIEMVASLATKVKTKQELWKWVITAMQNTMQAAMVLALTSDDGCGAFGEDLSTTKRNLVGKDSRTTALYHHGRLSNST